MAKLKIEFEFDEDKLPMAVCASITDVFSSLTRLIDTINVRKQIWNLGPNTKEKSKE